MPLVLSRAGVQDHAAAEGFHRRIEPDNKPVRPLNGQGRVKAELDIGAFSRPDLILVQKDRLGDGLGRSVVKMHPVAVS